MHCGFLFFIFVNLKLSSGFPLDTQTKSNSDTPFDLGFKK